jgi:hypothetical protein
LKSRFIENAGKVSRQQAELRLHRDGHFYLLNTGRRTILVNSRAVESGATSRLPHNALVQIAGILLCHTLSILQALFGFIEEQRILESAKQRL